MRDKILIAVIFLMCCILLVPPMFSSGFLFDATREHELCDGTIYVEHGLYYTKVFNVILLILMSFLGLIIPYLKPNLNKYWKWVACAAGSWFLFGLIYEAANFIIIDPVMEAIENNHLLIKCILIFSLSVTFIITHSVWHKEKSLKS